MPNLPSENDCLKELNQELRQHPDYEKGMKFTELGPRGSVSFCDPRLDAFLNGKRPHDFTLAPFEAAIKAYQENHRP